MAVGYYQTKQLRSPSAWVRWSHGARYAKGIEFVRRMKPRSVLDYGSGDGTFVAMIADLVPKIVASDVNANQLAECRNVNGHIPNLTFMLVKDLLRENVQKYDAVFCTEVLEHVVEDDLEEALANLRRLVDDDGHVIVSVPIEIGPTVLAKYGMRRILGFYGIGEYKWTEASSLRELLEMTFANEHTRLERPIYDVDGDPSARYHSHKGFNWRALRLRLQSYFDVEHTAFSPLPWSRGLASSQAWFVCRPKR